MCNIVYFVHRYVMKANKLYLRVCNHNEVNIKHVIYSENIFTILDLLTVELNVILILL